MAEVLKKFKNSGLFAKTKGYAKHLGEVVHRFEEMNELKARYTAEMKFNPPAPANAAVIKAPQPSPL